MKGSKKFFKSIRLIFCIMNFLICDFNNEVKANDSIFLKGIIINSVNYHFFFSSEYEVYLTKNCKEDNCEVKQVLSSLRPGEIFKYKGDFINPGSQICEGKDGQIVRGKTKNKSEISFCLFKDNSLISLNSLAKVALKKK